MRRRRLGTSGEKLSYQQTERNGSMGPRQSAGHGAIENFITTSTREFSVHLHWTIGGSVDAITNWNGHETSVNIQTDQLKSAFNSTLIIRPFPDTISDVRGARRGEETKNTHLKHQSVYQQQLVGTSLAFYSLLPQCYPRNRLNNVGWKKEEIVNDPTD